MNALKARLGLSSYQSQPRLENGGKIHSHLFQRLCRYARNLQLFQNSLLQHVMHRNLRVVVVVAMDRVQIHDTTSVSSYIDTPCSLWAIYSTDHRGGNVI